MGSVPMMVKGIEANPWTIGIVRLLIATVCVAVFLKDGRRVFQHRAEFKPLFLIGLAFALHWATYFISIKMADASIAAIGTATYGIFAAMLGSVMLGQVPNRIQVFAILISLVGAVLVVGEYSIGSEMTVGFIFALVSAILYAFVPILHQKHVHIPVNVRTLAQYLFALPVFVIALPWSNWDLKPIDWGGMLYLGIVNTVIAHTLWIRSSSVLPAYMSGILFYLYVPISMILCHQFLGEEMGWMRITGAAMIVVASVLGMRSQLAKRPGKQAAADG